VPRFPAFASRLSSAAEGTRRRGTPFRHGGATPWLPHRGHGQGCPLRRRPCLPVCIWRPRRPGRWGRGRRRCEPRACTDAAAAARPSTAAAAGRVRGGPARPAALPRPHNAESTQLTPPHLACVLARGGREAALPPMFMFMAIPCRATQPRPPPPPRPPLHRRATLLTRRTSSSSSSSGSSPTATPRACHTPR
jgi:hypothetical protein